MELVTFWLLFSAIVGIAAAIVAEADLAGCWPVSYRRFSLDPSPRFAEPQAAAGDANAGHAREVPG